METRQKKAQRFVSELHRPLRLDTLGGQEKMALAESLKTAPWFQINAHGGVSGGAFRVPKGKVLVLLTPPGLFGRSLRDDRRLKEARGRVLSAVTEGVPQASRVPPIPDSYLRIFLPGDWAPDAALAFTNLPDPGVVPLSLTEKPWFKALAGGEDILGLLAMYAESRSLVPLRGIHTSLGDLFHKFIPDVTGVFVSYFCRFADSAANHAFDMALNRVGFGTRQTSVVLRDPIVADAMRNWRAWPLNDLEHFRQTYENLKLAVQAGTDPDIIALKAMFPRRFFPMTRDKYERLFPDLVINIPKPTPSHRMAQVDAEVQNVERTIPDVTLTDQEHKRCVTLDLSGDLRKPTRHPFVPVTNRRI
ncbi:hypothetical protein KFL_002190140 [Klebsormidium nitens]|uniref:Uncharacterized protein n=1 Tax=Klebsormidium nitens TaxID=105231 RepID=A0A1Y1IAD2_KLENI|nr:hypothetical protein KFL_002190140 [Klebsormidium nitens]|eukprot:GAQ85058.1 hypothetical protein KFL_002190140 [Klebsormidium nitens]